MTDTHNTDSIITELNKPWAINSDKLKFFVGYDHFSEKIRLSQKLDLSKILSHYRENIKHKFPLNQAVIEYQLLKTARDRNDEKLLDQFYTFADDLFLEKKFLISSAPRTVSFLAHQGIASRADEKYSAFQKTHSNEGIELTRRKLTGVFEHFPDSHKHLYFRDLVSSRKNPSERHSDLFEAICLAHHEVIDNIDHWMDIPLNKNLNANNRSKFGDTLVVSVSSVTSASYGVNPHQKTEPMMRNFIQSTIEDSNKKVQHFWQLEYFDNGRGITRNYTNFGRGAANEPSLLDVIKDHLSIRPGESSGLGFTHILEQAKEINGFFSITSGEERVLYSRFAAEELFCQPADTFKFGTHLNLLFPVQGN